MNSSDIDKINELFKKDKTLNELLDDYNSFVEKNRPLVMQRKIEIAKENKLIVNDISELICEIHNNSKFGIITQIPNSHVTINNEIMALNIYRCDSCENNAETFRPEKSMAYDCPVCGIVKGNVKRIPFTSSRDSWKALAGREGVHYHCKVCDSKIGYKYRVFS